MVGRERQKKFINMWLVWGWLKWLKRSNPMDNHPKGTAMKNLFVDIHSD